MFYTRLFFIGYMRNHVFILALLQLRSGMITFIGKYYYRFFFFNCKFCLACVAALCKALPSLVFVACVCTTRLCLSSTAFCTL